MLSARIATRLAVTTLGLLLAIQSPAFAGDGTWHVGKTTGAVWVTKSQAQAVSLTDDTTLQAGDSITTGRNGRVLLARGEERILVSPNSEIGIPAQNADGMQTTITQRAGSILLDVEKKNVRHFEVETPYLAAVVKGTQFRVTVDGRGARVNVTRGQVQVADFKSGQVALVLPGQAARVLSRGQRGLLLTGKGRLNPIQRGTPRSSSVQALAVPKGGLTPVHTAADDRRTGDKTRKANLGDARSAFAREVSGPRNGTARITAPIGEMKLDFHKVTKGLAHDAGNPHTRGADAKGSIFSDSNSKGIGQIDATGKAAAGGNGGSASAIAASGGGSSAAAAGNGGNGGASGNGNAGGNGLGLGLGNGNGLGLGLGNGNGLGLGLGNGKAKGN